MKTKILLTKAALLVFAASFLLFTGVSANAAATITIINGNAPGVGFNDPTPRVPVGGNNGTTLGEQRLIAFQFAANRWGETIDSPVPVVILATFEPLGANVLGSAGAINIFRDFPGAGLFPGAEFPNTWYSAALADKRAGFDLFPPDSAGVHPEIRARFSSDFNFYLGLDNVHGSQPDLVTVLLHEFAHGLGFQSFVNVSSGAALQGFPDVYGLHLLDTSTGLHWDEMTAAQRQAAAVKFGRVIWDGRNGHNDVNIDLPNVLMFGSPEMRVNSPASIAGPYQFGTAAFGAPIGSPGTTGTVVAAVDAADAAGPTTTDGCSSFTNAAAIAGNIALIERGTCGFVVKAKNAQNAGAIGVIIYNNAANAAAAPPGMAGVDATVTVTSVSLARADGLAILAQLPNVNAQFGVDLSIRAGADSLGRARLYAPFPVVGGSSISHFDSIASKNLLMEPAISPDLTHNLKSPDDLTWELLTDIGWFADADNDGAQDSADCNPHSNLSDTVVIGGIDTGAPNYLFQGGCTSNDYIAQFAAEAKNHGSFVNRVAAFANALLEAGLITEEQKDAIVSAAGRSGVGGKQ